MSPKFNFAEWLKQEMTSVASVGGGGTFTGDIAQFARPLFSGEMVRRKWADEEPNESKKKKRKLKESNVSATYIYELDKIIRLLRYKIDGTRRYKEKPDYDPQYVDHFDIDVMDHFITALEKDPKDKLTWSAFADWLEENNASSIAGNIRMKLHQLG